MRGKKARALRRFARQATIDNNGVLGTHMSKKPLRTVPIKNRLTGEQVGVYHVPLKPWMLDLNCEGRVYRAVKNRIKKVEAGECTV